MIGKYWQTMLSIFKHLILALSFATIVFGIAGCTRILSQEDLSLKLKCADGTISELKIINGVDNISIRGKNGIN